MQQDEKQARLTKYSQILRKEMTKEERHLWYDFLKKLTVTVNRQKVIDGYIVDFYCAEAKIVIELDGSQHYEEDAKQKDRIRDQHLAAMGIKVLRYTNLEVNKHFKAVCRDIQNQINARAFPLVGKGDRDSGG